MEGVPGEFVTNHFHIDRLAQIEPYAADEVLIDPRLKFTHPGLSVSLCLRPQTP